MANLAFSGFFQDVRMTDGTNPQGDLASRPLFVAPPGTSVTLQASTVFSTGTTIGTITTGLGNYREFAVLLNITAVSGSPASPTRIFLQVSPDASTTWTDYASSAEITAVSTQWGNFSGESVDNALAATADATLAAGTKKGGPFGDRIRVKVVVTTATSITATITAFFK